MFKLNDVNFEYLEDLKFAALKFIDKQYIDEYELRIDQLDLKQINDYLPDDVKAWEDYDFDILSDSDAEIVYKNINSGKVLTEEEYYQLLRKEARELGAPVFELFSDDDDFKMIRIPKTVRK